MVGTGKQGAMTQQFTMKTFIPQFDFKGRNGLVRMKAYRGSIGGYRLMVMVVRGARRGGGRHQDHPKTGQ